MTESPLSFKTFSSLKTLSLKVLEYANPHGTILVNIRLFTGRHSLHFQAATMKAEIVISMQSLIVNV